MIVATRRESNIARPVWKHPAQLRDECDEMRFEIPLQMRQISPIERHVGILPPRQKNCWVKDGIREDAFPLWESRRGGRIRPPASEASVAGNQARALMQATRTNASGATCSIPKTCNSLPS